VGNQQNENDRKAGSNTCAMQRSTGRRHADLPTWINQNHRGAANVAKCCAAVLEASCAARRYHSRASATLIPAHWRTSRPGKNLQKFAVEAAGNEQHLILRGVQMFPIAKEALSFREISDYWSR
jgi:hypothetical protein